MAVITRPVSFREILSAPNAQTLFDEYSAECSIPELAPINPQPYLYEAMERSGGLQCFGVYEDETLVGFAAVLIYVLPHYGKKIATTESIFIAEKQRHYGLGRELLFYIEKYAKEHGCSVFLYTAPAGSRFAKMLSINADRYRRTNIVYLRSLA